MQGQSQSDRNFSSPAVAVCIKYRQTAKKSKRTALNAYVPIEREEKKIAIFVCFWCSLHCWRGESQQYIWRPKFFLSQQCVLRNFLKELQETGQSQLTQL